MFSVPLLLRARGLWTLKSGAEDVATIDKDLEISRPANFTGSAIALDAGSSMSIGGLFMLPNETAMTSCLPADLGALRRNEARHGLEICDGAGGWQNVGVRELAALEDGGGDYSGHAGDFLRVRADESGIEYTSAGLFDLHNVDGGGVGPGVGHDSYFKWDGYNAEAIFGPLWLTDAADFPDDYTGQGGKLLAVNTAANAVEFIDVPAVPSSFTDLDDTPNSYPFGSGGKLLAVKATLNGLEFVDAPGGGASTFTGLTDTPSSYSGQANKVVKVNGSGTGLVFANESGGGGTLNCSEVSVNSSSLAVATCPSGRIRTGGICIGAMSAPNTFYQANGWSCLNTGAGTVNAIAICCSIE